MEVWSDVTNATAKSVLLVPTVCRCPFYSGAAQFRVGSDGRPDSHTRLPAAPNPGNLPDDVNEVLCWLPQETEAVLVSRGKVPPGTLSADVFPALSGDNGSPEYVPPVYQDLVAAECIEPLVIFSLLYPHPDRLIRSFYGRKTAKLFVKAVWWDRDTRRETCDVVVFRDGTAARIIESLAAFPNVRRRIEDVPTLEVDLNYNGDR